VAKIESGKSSLALEDVELEQTIREVVALQSVEASQRGLWLRVIPFAKVVIHADPARLNQVILNLVSNAIKFTDTGGITIETRIQDTLDDFEGFPSQLPLADEAEPPTKWAVVSIIDTGIGIDPSQLPKLCQPFIMVDTTKTRRHGGTGLGLAISRNLVELMHGWVSLQSEGIGKGTTVKVALPIVRIVSPSDTVIPINSEAIADSNHGISPEGVALTPANIIEMNGHLKTEDSAEVPASSTINSLSS
ncbi:MAG: hypothetical protein F6K36_30825, partial [Symploca sp. SIO3C6]|nr:hypothetical protein [Symploca sp. SIO3C6]